MPSEYAHEAGCDCKACHHLERVAEPLLGARNGVQRPIFSKMHKSVLNTFSGVTLSVRLQVTRDNASARS